VRSLLDCLAREPPEGERKWQGWYVTRILGGWNNQLYRATRGEIDLAIKFTIRDPRDRAGREYGALRALRNAGLAIAPQPVLFDRDTYSQPVVVQTWLSGRTRTAPPETDAEWTCLLRHLALAHSVTPERGQVHLPRAVSAANDIRGARVAVQEEVARIPLEGRPPSLCALIRRFEAVLPSADLPHGGWVPFALCRTDLNTRNFIERPGGTWASVDWENAGWGDPAVDVAELMTHAAYVDVPAARWNWVVDAYRELSGDTDVAARIWGHYYTMAVWWVARLARYLYEIPRGLDRRLVGPPPGFPADVEIKYARYLRLATRVLDRG
jgi:aminoglycoside phosphotransferase (APT) family kinase protein